MVWPRPGRALVRLFGIPLAIDRSWFVVAAFLTWSLATEHFPWRSAGLPTAVYWAMGAAAAVLLFICVLLHELGHALVAKFHGIPVAGITLFFFGGVAQLAGESKRPLVELSVTLAGPLISGVLAGACFWLSRALPAQTPLELVAAAIVSYLAMINTAILVFNLLPGFPLDGGRILRAVLWALTGNWPMATRITSTLGSWLGLGLLALAVWAISRGE